MNILLTSTGFLEDREHGLLIQTWRDHHHIVETLPFERLMAYLSFDPSSRWAAVDAVVCKADTDPEGIAAYTFNVPLSWPLTFVDFPNLVQ